MDNVTLKTVGGAGAGSEAPATGVAPSPATPAAPTPAAPPTAPAAPAAPPAPLTAPPSLRQARQTCTADTPSAPRAARLRRLARTAVTLALAAAGVLSLAYGASIYALNTGSTFFLFWFIVGGGALLWALALARNWTARVPRSVKLAFAGIFIACTAVGGTAWIALMGHVHDEPPAGVDYLMVLGAQVTPSGPSTVLRLRLDAAVHYLDANPQTLVVVTGCQGPNEPWPEAHGMRDYLIAQGIDPARILVEDRAEDTEQNIAFSRALIPANASVAIVSNNFHIYRALEIAKHQGLTEVYGLATPLSPYAFLNNTAREVIAIICYKLLGRM